MSFKKIVFPLFIELDLRNLSLRFPTRSDTNQPVQSLNQILDISRRGVVVSV